MLTEILMGGLNALDLVPSMLRDVAGGSNPFDQFRTPFSQDNRLSGRDVLQNWGAVGENTEGLDWGDVGGFALDMALDPFLIAAPLRAMSKGGRLASQMGDTAVHAAKPHGLDIRSLLMGGAPAAGETDAVNLAAGLSGETPAMSPWQAMAFNRRSRQMIDEGAMPAAVARETKARTVDPDLYDTLRGDEKNRLQSAWRGGVDADQLGISEEGWVPARLYHGTSHGDLAKSELDIMKTDPYNLFGRGFYTSNDPRLASSYTGKNMQTVPELEFGPNLLPKKIQELADNHGLVPRTDTPEGEQLALLLQGNTKYLNLEAAADDLMENPELSWGDWDNRFRGDGGATAAYDRDLENALRGSSVIKAHDPEVVQKWMLDSRNPLDLEAAVPGMDYRSGTSPRTQMIDNMEGLLNQAYPLTGFDEVLDYLKNVDPQTLPGVSRTVSYATEDELLELYEAIKAGENYGAFKNSKIKPGGVSPGSEAPQVLENMNKLLTGPLEDLRTTNAVVALNKLAMSKPLSEFEPWFLEGGRVLRDTLDAGELPMKAFLDALDGDRTLLNMKLNNPPIGGKRSYQIRDFLSTVDDGIESGAITKQDAMNMAERLDNPEGDSLWDLWRNVEEAGEVARRDLRDTIDLMTESMSGSGGRINTRARAEQAVEEFFNNPGDVSGEFQGADLYDVLRGINPRTTHRAFRDLGYDALTHTGGVATGNSNKHRVFIGLDPEKMYKGHAIAPDEIDVWTLRNILAGTPTVQAPIRALGAEM